jgi:type I restriction enzyme R subunit
MKNILMDEVKLRLHKTSKKYTSLKDELERVIENYHKNAIDSYTTIAELIERAKLLKKRPPQQRIGLSDEELAFYDTSFKEGYHQEAGPVQDIVHGSQSS